MSLITYTTLRQLYWWLHEATLETSSTNYDSPGSRGDNRRQGREDWGGNGEGGRGGHYSYNYKHDRHDIKHETEAPPYSYSGYLVLP